MTMANAKKVTLVCATTQRADLFPRSTYLGRSLARVPDEIKPSLRLYPENSGARARGLGELYNEAISELDNDEIVLLVHDDVYINDWCIIARLNEAVAHYDVIGLAGSINPDLSQPSWGLAFDNELTTTGWQDNLRRSGVVNHFDYGYPTPTYYGPAPLQCRLLDGLFLAGKVGRWRETGATFDPRFRFHLYDLDFCRTAELAGLTLGTWPISVTHDSRGGFDSLAFRETAGSYLEKWAK